MRTKDFNETYDTKEIYEINENKVFKAIVYQVPELTKFENETYDTPEIKGKTDIETPKKAKKNSDINDINRGNKLSNIVSRVATTAAATSVAASVVVVASTFIAPMPKMEIVDIEVGYTDVSLIVNVEDTTEDTTYRIVVDNTSYEFSMDLEEGTTEVFIDDLTPYTKYNVSLQSSNGEVGGYSTITKSSFYTLKKEVMKSFTIIPIFDYEYGVMSLEFDIDVSKEVDKYENFYLEVVYNDELYYSINQITNDYHFHEMIYELEIGTYIFNVYGEEKNLYQNLAYNDTILIASYTYNLQYPDDYNYLDAVNISFNNNSINISGIFNGPEIASTIGVINYYLYSSGQMNGQEGSTEFEINNNEFIVDIVNDYDAIYISYEIQLISNDKIIYYYYNSYASPQDLLTADDIEFTYNETYKNIIISGDILPFAYYYGDIEVEICNNYDEVIVSESIELEDYVFEFSCLKTSYIDVGSINITVVYSDFDGNQTTISKAIDFYSSYTQYSNQITEVTSEENFTYVQVKVKADAYLEENISYLTLNFNSYNENDEITTIQYDYALATHEDEYIIFTCQKLSTTSYYSFNIYLDYYDFDISDFSETIYDDEIIYNNQMPLQALDFIIPDVNDYSITYYENTLDILIPFEFDLDDSNLTYKVELISNDEVIKEFIGSTSNCSFTAITNTDKEIIVRYYFYAFLYDENEYLITTIDGADNLIIETPLLDITEYRMVDDGLLLCGKIISNVPDNIYNSITLNATYGDLSTESKMINSFNSDNSFEILLEKYNDPEGSFDFILSYLSPYSEQTLSEEYTSFTHIRESEVLLSSARVIMNEFSTYDCEFIFNYYLLDNSQIYVQKDGEEPEIITGNVFAIDELSSGEYTYSYGIYQNGIYLESINELTFTTEHTADYVIEGIHPSSAIVTYNDDNTENIYLDFEFSSENENVMYEVLLYDYDNNYTVYTSRDRVFILENMPLEYYYYKLNVIVKDGMYTYGVYNFFPSGGFDILDVESINLNSTVTDGNTGFIISADFSSIAYYIVGDIKVIIDEMEYTAVLDSNDSLYLEVDEIINNNIEFEFEYSRYNMTIDELLLILDEEGLTLLGDINTTIKILDELS